MSEDTLLQKAQAGDANAMCRLAISYEMGLGRTQDIKQAAFWLRRAAAQQSPWALKKLAEYAKKGKLGKVDLGTEERIRERLFNMGNPARSDKVTAVANQTAGKILLVDDDPDILDHWNEYLLPIGYTILKAGTPKVALEIIKNTSDLKLVFFDFEMPQANGFQFMNGLSQLGLLSNLKVFICSVDADKAKIAHAKKMGVVSWLVKPVPPKKLKEVIAKTMGEIASKEEAA
tara:strand:- start:27 stop:719 length:693 start_codon:yes stop_codon:yes gene_type:complete